VNDCPQVSICIPVRNEERYLAATLESVRRQSFEDFEVVVHDNASTDRTVEIVEGIAATDRRFRCVRHAVNIGQQHNVARCYVGARGDYVLLLSGNDLIAETYLERVLAAHAANPDSALVYAKSIVIDAHGREMERLTDQQQFETRVVDPFAAFDTVASLVINAGTVFATYRRGVLEKLQPMRHAFAADSIFVAEAALYGDIVLVDEHLYQLRNHKRQQPLVKIFSEYFNHDNGRRDVVALLDLAVPQATLLHGFIDMIMKADIPASWRPALVETARSAVRRRSDAKLAEQRENLAKLLKAALPMLTRRDPSALREWGRAQVVHRLLHASMLFDDDRELNDAVRALVTAQFDALNVRAGALDSPCA
jgi:glycosyltransferase involved in cell wall biosynthesis